MSGQELLALFAHFFSLAIFATGGAIGLASDMHRYVVDEHAYITHTQFVNSIALAQSAPGPNLLFVTVMGWQIAGALGALTTTCAIAAPALILPLVVSRLSGLAQFDRLIAALKRGLGPVAIGLMVASSYLLVRETPGQWKGLLIIAATFLLGLLTRLPPALLIVFAGVSGALISW